MNKLLLTFIMMFTLGTSTVNAETVNAEENTTNIEDRISELAEINSDSQSTVEDKVGELSEDELETIIANVNELSEPTGDDLAIKDAAISKLEEMKSVETPNILVIGIGALGISLMLSALTLLLAGYRTESRLPLMLGVLLIVIMKLFAM